VLKEDLAVRESPAGRSTPKGARSPPATIGPKIASRTTAFRCAARASWHSLFAESYFESR